MEESTTLVSQTPPPPAPLAKVGEGMEGWEIRPAAMSLDQPVTSVEGASPGKFRDTLTGSTFETLQVVPLGIFTNRVLFPAGAEFGADPLCRSNDGIRPAADAAVPQDELCAQCEQGPKLWAKYKTTKTKPPCQEKARVVFVLRDSGLPYVITFGGMALKNLRNLKTAIARDAAVSAAKGQTLNLYDYTFIMKPVKVTGGKGSYYVCNFSELRRVTSPGEFGPLYHKYVVKHREEIQNAVDIDAEVVDEAAV